MTVGLKTIKGNRYFFMNNGVMKKNGCAKVSGKLYYFMSSGKGYKKKGWFKGSDKKKRYSLGKGRVAIGTMKISGKWYQFNTSNGVLTKSLGDDFDRKVQKKSSDTNYLVAVNRSTYQVRVYTGSKNNWTRSKTFTCGIGAPKTPTKAGTFKVAVKGESFKYVTRGKDVRYWYYTNFYNDKGFHSGIYYDDDGPNKAYDTKLKTASSQGSIRLSLENAKWIYYNIPMYTTVVVY